MISVSGRTVEEIEELLSGKIKLYENPQVSVKFREYASHPINVLGLSKNRARSFSSAKPFRFLWSTPKRSFSPKPLAR